VEFHLHQPILSSRSFKMLGPNPRVVLISEFSCDPIWLSAGMGAGQAMVAGGRADRNYRSGAGPPSRLVSQLAQRFQTPNWILPWLLPQTALERSKHMDAA
jgi:hypothetical protein